jgi:hypothetical protein
MGRMVRKLRQRRLWLLLAWKAIARALARTPHHHPAWSYLYAASRAAENGYWRQVHTRLHHRSRVTRGVSGTAR